MQTAGRQAIVDTSHHLGENVVGKRRHQHAENLGACRSQCPRIRVRDIAELVDGSLDLAAQIFRDPLRLAQGARYGDGADAGLARNIGDGRAAAAPARARLNQGPARSEEHPPKRGRDTIVLAVVISPGPLCRTHSSSGVAQRLVLVKQRETTLHVQAIAMARCLAFQNNSPIASMFSRFQAIPLRNAAA